MWGYVAAAALPYVVGALQKKPNAPRAPKAAQLPDRSAYIDAILNGGFNQNVGGYAQAAEIANENVNRILAKQGLAGSSIGAQAAIAQQNELANTFVEEELRRRQEALRLVHGIDMDQAGITQNNNNAAYQHSMMQYEDAMRRRAGVVQGIGAIANAGASAYYGNQANAMIDKRRAEDRAWMTNLYQNNQPMPMPMYGTPGYTGSTPGYQLPAYYSPYMAG